MDVAISKNTFMIAFLLWRFYEDVFMLIIDTTFEQHIRVTVCPRVHFYWSEYS